MGLKSGLQFAVCKNLLVYIKKVISISYYLDFDSNLIDFHLFVNLLFLALHHEQSWHQNILFHYIYSYSTCDHLTPVDGAVCPVNIACAVAPLNSAPASTPPAVDSLQGAVAACDDCLLSETPKTTTHGSMTDVQVRLLYPQHLRRRITLAVQVKITKLQWQVYTCLDMYHRCYDHCGH